MSLLAILDIVLGLVFVWLTMSLGVITLQEWLAACFRWRARMLELAIRNILGDDALADQLYNHPLIRSLYTGRNAEAKPSYMPASHFAQALFDLAIYAGSEASLFQQQLYLLREKAMTLGGRRRRALRKRLNLLLAMARRALVATADEIPDETATSDLRVEMDALAHDFPALAAAVTHSLNAVAAQQEKIASALAEWQRQRGGWSQETTLDRLRLGLVALGVTHPRLKQTLQALLSGVEEYATASESPLERARRNIEVWFENAMARRSGWYKRRAQWLAFALGLLLAVCLNVDTFQIAGQLWRAGALRSLLSQQAVALAAQNELPADPASTLTQVVALQEQLNRFHLPVGWFDIPIESPPDICRLLPRNTQDVYGLAVAGRCYPLVNTPLPGDMAGWVLKLGGLLLTALAAAQGAPFWFDVLKRIANIRLAGRNPSENGRTVG